MTPAQREHILINCRASAWQRAAPALQALHVPAGASPQVLIDWLLDCTPTQRAEAERVLWALAAHPWAASRLPRSAYATHRDAGVVARCASQGLIVAAGRHTWWLQFQAQPRVHVHRIERFEAPVAAA